MVDLPEPLTPVTQQSRPSGMSRSTPAQVVDARAGEAQMFAARLTAVFRRGDGEAAREVLSGDGVRVGSDFGYSASGEELAAEFACAGTEVEKMVGGADTSGSCSTTRIVLPRSRRSFMMSMSLAVSRVCRPMLGSSRT